MMPIDTTQPTDPENTSGQEMHPEIEVEINRLSSTVKTALKRAQKKSSRQIFELQEAQASDRYQQQADSILANIHNVPSWANSCKVINVHTNKLETITLNTKHSPKENAEHLYKKARKGRRGVKVIAAWLNETKTRIGVLEAARQELGRLYNSVQPADEIRHEFAQLLASLSTYNLGNSTKQGTARLKVPEPEQVPYRHITLEGWDIFIGRTNSQNDELTTRFAKPSDIWMHVATHAGSHLIIRRDKNSEWPPGTILHHAASFAAWFSKAKHSSYAEVHVAEKRFVSKRRHAPTGQVIVTKYKTISVTPLSPHDYFKKRESE